MSQTPEGGIVGDCGGFQVFECFSVLRRSCLDRFRGTRLRKRQGCWSSLNLNMRCESHGGRGSQTCGSASHGGRLLLRRLLRPSLILSRRLAAETAPPKRQTERSRRRFVCVNNSSPSTSDNLRRDAYGSYRRRKEGPGRRIIRNHRFLRHKPAASCERYDTHHLYHRFDYLS